jgi:hypothetical protein
MGRERWIVRQGAELMKEHRKGLERCKLSVNHREGSLLDLLASTREPNEMEEGC